MKLNKYLIVGLIASPLIIAAVYYFGVNQLHQEMEVRGQFGDMFGGLNAIFSGLAFLGVIYAILLQRSELELQREELKLTRKELTRTAEAQELSQRELSKQAASLKATAKLNGLSALLQRYSSLRDESRVVHDFIAAKEWSEKSEQVTSEIEAIINPK